MKNSLLYQGDLSYDSIFYRALTENLVAGISSIIEPKNIELQPDLTEDFPWAPYQEIFRQGAEVCKSYLIGVGFQPDEVKYSASQMEDAELLKNFLRALMKKHGAGEIQNYPFEKIEDIARALIFFSGGTAHSTSYPREQLESMYDFFWELHEIFDKECEDSGVYIEPCSLVTQPSHTLQ